MDKPIEFISPEELKKQMTDEEIKQSEEDFKRFYSIPYGDKEPIILVSDHFTPLTKVNYDE